jgi:deazaflavin-dependent oxidoreductase (nitroreductase family)
MWTPKGRVLKAIVLMQRTSYRTTGGRVLSRARGNPMLLITTRGRRTGRLRTTPLPYFPDGDHMVVVASNSAQEHHPAWYLNLVARPEIDVQVGPHRSAAVARRIEGEEAARIWSRLERDSPWYLQYQASTEREIPLVALETERPVNHDVPVGVDRPALGWWVSILSGMGLLGLLAHRGCVWHWWERRVTGAVPRPVYRVVFWIAVGLHVGEAAYAVREAERDGRSASSLRWGL